MREKTVILQDDFKVNDHGFGKAVIAVMKNFKALKEAGDIVRETMEGAGIVQYVGGRFIMVSFKSGEEVERFCSLAKEMGDRFQSVDKWSGQTLSLERLSWLRIQGIPLHLLDNEVINRIGESFGKVFHGGRHDKWDSDLSYDYVGVLVSEGRRIQEEVILQWKGRRYRIWVEEQNGDWEPDFSGKERGVEQGPTSNQVSQSSEKGMQNLTGILDGGVQVDDLERPQILQVIKERFLDDQTGMVEKDSFAKNMEEHMGVFKESHVGLGEVFKGRKLAESDTGPTVKKRRNVTKKGGVGRMGHQVKMVSVDERPTSRKRPRLDVDPKGLDPFGLNILLGINNNAQVESVQNNTTGTEDERVSTNFQDQSSVKSDQQSTGGDRDAGIPNLNFEADVTEQRNEEVSQVDRETNTDDMEEIEDTIKLGEIVGANLGEFRGLVSVAVEEEGLQAGKV
ncbi:hypothetical protein Hdeb2414_s0003g00110471 [Helianthus debilis subsp. tardiflorus]